MSKGLMGGIAAVVVIVIIVVALLVAGVIPGLHPSSSSSPSAPTYGVTFQESGLPSGTSWSVTLAGSPLTSSSSAVVFQEKNGSYPFTIGSVSGHAASPASGTITVAGVAQTKTIAFTTGYSVTFNEAGLPAGTSWSVTLNGTSQSSTTSTISFSESNGTYTYSVASVSGYTANLTGGTVMVAGVSQSVSISFSALVAGQYSVTFTESGLVSGTSWSVTLSGSSSSSTSTSITFTEGNGSLPYTVGAVSGYTASPTGGTVNVSGSSAGVSITFTASSNSFTGPAYPVTFTQTGLPATDVWEADGFTNFSLTSLLFGQSSTGASTEFAIPDGTYFWDVSTDVSGYVVAPSFGNLTVSGHAVTIPVTFLPEYTVNFTETGLSVSAGWTVTLNGTNMSSNGNFNNSFLETNGTYSFTVTALGYSAAPSSGTVTVAGATVVKAIVFSVVPTYAVTFTETGLTASAFWSVTVNGTLYGSATEPASIVFHLPNGAYPFTVYATGYTAVPASGTVTVSSAPLSKAIAFTAIPTGTETFTETGVASGTDWYVDVNGTFGFAAAPANIVVHPPTGVQPFDTEAIGYLANPASGNVTVTVGGGTQHIVFTPLSSIHTNNVTFTETGLPHSSGWDVEVDSDGAYISASYYCTNSTTTTSMVCALPNGYYTWIVTTSVADYVASPMSGGLTLSSAPASVSVTFASHAGDYLLWFSDLWFQYTGSGGLANGTNWSVTVGGVTQSTQGMDLFFLEASGSTAAYTVTPPAGFVVLPSSGNVTGLASADQFEDYSTLAFHVWIGFVASSMAPHAGSAIGSSSFGVSNGSIIAAMRNT
jgi:hypothetical protein